MAFFKKKFFQSSPSAAAPAPASKAPEPTPEQTAKAAEMWDKKEEPVKDPAILADAIPTATGSFKIAMDKLQDALDEKKELVKDAKRVNEKFSDSRPPQPPPVANEPVEEEKPRYVAPHPTSDHKKK